MNILRYLILGIIQGFTEPIPVSSSGHLIIFRELLNFDFLYDLNFEIIVNFGSLIAILFFYKKDIAEILNDFILYIKTKKDKYKSNFKYAMIIITATIPAGLLGLLYKDTIEAISNPKTVGISLLMTAGLLFIIRNLKGTKDDSEITYKDAIYIGLYQAVALLPGVSRSGSTIAGGMIRGLKRDKALKFSFMLYIPISFATMVLGLSDFINSGSANTLWFPYSIGMIASAIVTYFTLKWFRNIMIKGKLMYFVYYCIIVGTLVLIFL